MTTVSGRPTSASEIIAVQTRGSSMKLVALAIGLLCSSLACAQSKLAREIYKELVEINTVTGSGDTGQAADAMAARLRAAGIPAADIQVFKPAPKKGNLVARLRG